MDFSQLTDLPLTVLVIVGAYWVIQRINDQHANQLVALTAQFTEKYIELYNGSKEDRDESRQRWLERDRLLISTLIENQKSLVENAKENHSLRSTLTPLVLWWEAERRRREGGNPDAADRNS